MADTSAHPETEGAGRQPEKKASLDHVPKSKMFLFVRKAIPGPGRISDVWEQRRDVHMGWKWLSRGRVLNIIENPIKCVSNYESLRHQQLQTIP